MSHYTIPSNGFAIIPHIVQRAPNISALAKTIYVLLVGHAGTKGTCFPSLTCLQNESGLSRPTVIKLIKELESVGLIGVVRNTYGRPNKYRILSLDHFNSSYVISASKGDLLGSKTALPPVVNDVYPKKNKEEKQIKKNGTSAFSFEALVPVDIGGKVYYSDYEESESEDEEEEG